MKERTKTAAIISTYLSFNIILTLHSKWTMNHTGLNIPWLLSAIHCSFSGIGSLLLAWMVFNGNENENSSIFPIEKIAPSDIPELFFYSSLFTINIAFSNWSLEISSILINQSMKALSSPITMFLEFITLYKVPSNRKIISLLPIIIGIPLICLDRGKRTFTSSGGGGGDSSISIWISLSSVCISSLKIVETKKLLLKGYDPLHLIVLMSLPAIIQSLMVSYWVGEFNIFNASKDNILILAINGLIALALNVSAFYSTKLTSALSMSVTGSIKQLTSILIGIFIFNSNSSIPNLIGLLGIGLVVLGMLLYVISCNDDVLK